MPDSELDRILNVPLPAPNPLPRPWCLQPQRAVLPVQHWEETLEAATTTKLPKMEPMVID